MEWADLTAGHQHDTDIVHTVLYLWTFASIEKVTSDCDGIAQLWTKVTLLRLLDPDTSTRRPQPTDICTYTYTYTYLQKSVRIDLTVFVPTSVLIWALAAVSRLIKVCSAYGSLALAPLRQYPGERRSKVIRLLSVAQIRWTQNAS